MNPFMSVVCIKNGMELMPILGPEDTPREKQWYALAPGGEAPGVSVGHTCTFVPCGGGRGRIVIVGGADPGGSFPRSCIVDLERHEWGDPGWDGLQARYEHCTFVTHGDPTSLWVFGGADQSSNHNSVQVLRTTDSGPWRSVDTSGTPPSPRTYHATSACIEERLFVFSGGDAGAQPVIDPQVHVFDTVSRAWSQPETEGERPRPRHGHAVVGVGRVLYIHGGMEGETLHSDLFALDTETMKWERVSAEGDVPPGTAAHSAVASQGNIYIFGGMTAGGASSSMYKFQTDDRRWTSLRFHSDLPPSRLDHSMCLVPWPKRAGASEDSPGDGGPEHLCFVFGGMDTRGAIFNDCLVTLIT